MDVVAPRQPSAPRADNLHSAAPYRPARETRTARCTRDRTRAERGTAWCARRASSARVLLALPNLSLARRSSASACRVETPREG
eukprot:31479-Pelagococcus_subviridis.AAC.3